MKVYVITDDGYEENYGSEIYLMGVFSDIEKAKRRVRKYGGKITEIEVDKIYPLKEVEFGNKANEYYLGGYYE